MTKEGPAFALRLRRGRRNPNDEALLVALFGTSCFVIFGPAPALSWRGTAPPIPLTSRWLVSRRLVLAARARTETAHLRIAARVRPSRGWMQSRLRKTGRAARVCFGQNSLRSEEQT